MQDDKTGDKIGGEKKIIIDEDWKSQVQAEKEAARHKQPNSQAEQSAAPGGELPMPAPTLTFLAGTLYLEGAMALGLFSNPETDKQPAVHPKQASHAIELLAMLQEKTAGNRTPEESEEIENMLHQLRMAYVTVTQK